MILWITEEQLEIPEIEELAEDYLLNGGKTIRGTDRTGYPLDAAGEMKITKDLLVFFYESGIEIEKATLYAQLPASMMDNLVDVDLPEAKYKDENGEEVRRVYSEYFKWQWELEDGSYLVRLVPVPYGATAGNGLSIEHFKMFYEVFADQILTKAEGLALMPTGEV
jgi:hypothetical protein